MASGTFLPPGLRQPPGRASDDEFFTLGTDEDVVYVLSSSAISAAAEPTGLIEGTSHHQGVAANSMVVSNIPAKVGGQLLQYWMTETHRRLQPGGMLWGVTVAGLKDYVKRGFRETFGNHRKVKQSGTHVVAMAIRDQE